MTQDVLPKQPLENRVYIYGLLDPDTGNLRYVGKTKQSPQKRLRGHLCPSALERRTHKAAWVKSLAARNREPIMRILDLVPAEVWEIAERAWISYFQVRGCALVNTAKGGIGRHSTADETKRLIAAKATGRTYPPEVRARMGLKKGFKHSEETKAKMRASSSRGIPLSDEASRAHSLRMAKLRGVPKARGDANPNTKVTDATVREIRALAADGASGRALAARYGLGTSTVARIVTGAARLDAGGLIRPARAKRRPLTADERRFVLHQRLTGVSARTIAEMLHINETSIYGLIRREATSDKDRPDDRPIG